jgi:hypothetical protein
MASSQPAGWASNWKYSGTVYWGFSNEEITYTFKTNGGSVVESQVSNFAITMPVCLNEGMYFGGWYDNEEFNGSPLSNVYYNSTSITLYAKWLTKEEAEIYYDGSTFSKAKFLDTMSFSVTITSSGKYYRFTATETKTYTISSSNSSIDSKGTLYNENHALLAKNDDVNYDRDRYNFSMSCELTAGETYILYVECFDTNSTFTVSIS